jgi:hypothetical protein
MNAAIWVAISAPSLQAGWHGTRAIASRLLKDARLSSQTSRARQVAELAAVSVGQEVVSVDCTSTANWAEAETVLDHLRPVLKNGGVIHIEIGFMSGDEWESFEDSRRQNAIIRLFTEIETPVDAVKPVVVVAETNNACDNAILHRRFNYVKDITRYAQAPSPR